MVFSFGLFKSEHEAAARAKLHTLTVPPPIARRFVAQGRAGVASAPGGSVNASIGMGS